MVHRCHRETAKKCPSQYPRRRHHKESDDLFQPANRDNVISLDRASADLELPLLFFFGRRHVKFQKCHEQKECQVWKNKITAVQKNGGEKCLTQKSSMAYRFGPNSDVRHDVTNPIEMVFAKLKASPVLCYRTIHPGFMGKIGSLLHSFSPLECSHYFVHPGYISI